MKYWPILLPALFWPVCLHADELILKDGKRVEWVALRDLGDTYEVETPQGTKITLKKDDVESLAKKKAPEVLTGATISFDKKKKLDVVDVLGHIDPKKDVVSGSWKMTGKVLSGGPGSGEPFQKLQISSFTAVPEEYDLTIVVEKKDATNGFFVGLIGGGHQFLLGFDYTKLTMSGIIDNLGNDVKEGRVVPGKFFAKGPKTLKFMVRKEAFVVQVDGKDFITWKADWPKLSIEDNWAVPAKNVFMLGVLDNSNYLISQMTLTTPREK